MKNYKNIDIYLDELEEEIYPAPSDEGHTAWAKDVIDKFLPGDVTTVLDIGCGEGFCKPLFPLSSFIRSKTPQIYSLKP